MLYKYFISLNSLKLIWQSTENLIHKTEKKKIPEQ
jgi:hypothetical protein